MNRQLPIAELDNLVQGRVNVPDYKGITGTPYLLLEYLTGTIGYLDHDYEGLLLRYDVFADELVFLYRSGTGIEKVQLTKEYIQYFTLGSRRFINLHLSKYRESGLKSGYYELVFEGKISLLAKRYANIEHRDAITSFDLKNNWILVREGQVHRLRNKKTLLGAFEDEHRKPISNFLRKELIILRKADDAQWLRIASYLNTLL